LAASFAILVYLVHVSESHKLHLDDAARHVQKRPVSCAVLTVSDTRTPETDKGGPMIQRLLAEAGHRTVAWAIVPDDASKIRMQLEQWLADATVQVILSTGGTGIGKRDTTIEVVRSLLTAELEGFGELFRMLSYEQVRAAAMMSRAVGGHAAGTSPQGTIIFAMPGSPAAVELAMTKLIVPQLAHLVWERVR
jgi:molybdenum cofactor biosynthesis protein B